MKRIEGNIVDVVSKTIRKGRVFFTDKIKSIQYDDTVSSGHYIMPGFIDAHVHIESSMLTPLEYSKVALRHGVIAAVTDPHEIANVCGVEGVDFMIENAKLTPMKLFFGAPSCVPATPFETSGATLSSNDIENLFRYNKCSHLAEMMNYPGIIFEDKEVISKLEIAKKYNKIVDGHAPLLSGKDLRTYIRSGIHTDHECTTIHEGLEKISLGMKIMLRNGSAAKDFNKLITLIKSHPDEVMLCADDCHPDELKQGYINRLVHEALKCGYDIFDILTASTVTANGLYNLNIGLLQQDDGADFIVVDALDNFEILKTFIDGNLVFDNEIGINFEAENSYVINNYFENSIDVCDLVVKRGGAVLKVIEVQAGSLLTKQLLWNLEEQTSYIESDISNDILKIVVLNRYTLAKPTVGFIKGFGLRKGAIAGSIAHDSHNIVAVGVSDEDIVSAIRKIHSTQGGLTVVAGSDYDILPLSIAGLMSDKSCSEVAAIYQRLSKMAIDLGCTLDAPFMTLAFMSLLVIPELKIGDKGLFDVSEFAFTNLFIE